jgi:hypothetical protein
VSVKNCGCDLKMLSFDNLHETYHERNVLIDFKVRGNEFMNVLLNFRVSVFIVIDYVYITFLLY